MICRWLKSSKISALSGTATTSTEAWSSWSHYPLLELGGSMRRDQVAMWVQGCIVENFLVQNITGDLRYFLTFFARIVTPPRYSTFRCCLWATNFSINNRHPWIAQVLQLQTENLSLTSFLLMQWYIDIFLENSRRRVWLHGQAW